MMQVQKKPISVDRFAAGGSRKREGKVESFLKPHPIFYRTLKAVAIFLFTVFCRIKVEGKENIPETGPVILAGNHISHIDPVAIATGCRRQIFYMAKHSLFEEQPWRWLVSNLGAFPVIRDTVDRNAIRIARSHLRNGHILGIFPEGTRNRGLENARNGVAWFAKKAKCPVIPVAVTGTNKIMPHGIKSLRLPRVTISFGEPIMPVDDYEVIFQAIVNGISGLLDDNKKLAELKA